MRANAAPTRRRVFLAGATGFLGQEVLRQLLQRGWEIVALSHHPRSREVPPGVIQVAADVLGDSWQRWCEGCCAVINLIGARRELPHLGVTFDRCNRQAAERIVATAVEIGIDRIVHVSAVSNDQAPATPFRQSKLDGEQVVLFSPLAATILRPTVIFGPGDHFATPLAKVLQRTLVVPIPGDGSSLFQPVAVEEVAEAVIASLDLPATVGQVINLGGPERLTITEVVHRVARTLGVRRTIVHLPLGLSRFLVRLAERFPTPRFTSQDLAAVLAGATCDTGLSSSVFDVPRKHFDGPTWLRQRRDCGGT